MHTTSKTKYGIAASAVLLAFLVATHPGAFSTFASRAMADVSDSVSSSTPDVSGDSSSTPALIDDSDATSSATSTDELLPDSNATTTATTTDELLPDDSDATSTATTTPDDASSTPSVPPPAPAPTPTPTPTSTPDALLPKSIGTIPQIGTLALLADGTSVRVRFPDHLTSSDQWSGVFARPRAVATSTVTNSVSAISFGPDTPISLDQFVRIEFAGQAASSTAAYLASDGTVAPISAQCVSGGAEAPRDLFLTYSGPDCVSHWGNDMVIITDHSGTFAAVRNP